MTATELRDAAALMRERAEAVDREDYSRRIVAKVGRRTRAGQHIAAADPTVMLAVADWLDEVAERQCPERGGTSRRSHGWTGSRAANAVAYAYLRREATS